jgi:hypothetical protein
MRRRIFELCGLLAATSSAIACSHEIAADEEGQVASPLAVDGRTAGARPMMPGPHGPPPEAFAACKDLTDGAACTVTFHDDTIDGTCHAGPGGHGPLACIPADMPPPPPPGPPPEAFAACKELGDGAACTVSFHGEALDGTCHSGPDGKGPLACVPADMPPPPPPGPPPEAFAACKELSDGAACTVSFHGEALDGTCRSGPDGKGPLACVPANMPPPPPPPAQQG